MTEPTFDPGFSTAEMSRVFSPRGHVAGILRYEAALAGALADVGLIEPDVAREVEARCLGLEVDAPDILARGWAAGSPLLPLIEEIRAGLSPDAASAVHRGATSQDAIDTALMLQAGVGLDALRAGLMACGAKLRDLAMAHVATPTMARTLLQPAGPMSFGARLALWLEPLVRHIDELEEARDNLALQLGGLAGDAAAHGMEAAAIATATAARLGLVAPPTSWHGDRSRTRAVVAAVAATCSSVDKVAGDIVLLAGFGEVTAGSGRSSSMPDKRNPIDAVRAVAAAQVCAAGAAVVLGARPPELERAAGGWQAEWLAFPLVFHTAGAAVEALDRSLGVLEVDQERMLEALGGVDHAAAIVAGERVVAAVTAAFSAVEERG
jgi:3-carboxy-cis,cis-muconate cycloisomerase